jgi:hypothetical protein
MNDLTLALITLGAGLFFAFFPVWCLAFPLHRLNSKAAYMKTWNRKSIGVFVLMIIIQLSGVYLIGHVKLLAEKIGSL